MHILGQSFTVVRYKKSKLKTQEEIYGTTRENMSKAMNEGVKIHGKVVFTLVGLLVEPITDIEKPKG